MRRKMYLNVTEVQQILDMKYRSASDLITTMNKELKEAGYVVVSGRLPIRYLEKRFYGLEHAEQYLEEERA